MENLELFRELTTEEYNNLKNSGGLPAAKVTVVRSDYPDPVTGMRRVYFAEVVSDPEARYIVKDTRNLEGEALAYEVEDIKHAFWAAVEDFHQKRHTVLEHGCHIRDFDPGTPEAEVGYVAAWNTNPKFAAYMPDEGWAVLKWRNGHYVKGGPAAEGAETKHDYMDMLAVGSANFRVFLPVFLAKWAEEVVNALKLGREESLNHSTEKLIGYTIKQDAFQGTKRDIATGNVKKAEELAVKTVEGQSPIDLATLEPGTVLHVYARINLANGVIHSHLTAITWNPDDAFVRGMVSRYARHYFSRNELA